MQRVREIAGVTVLMFDRRSFDGAVRVDRLAPSGGPGSPDVHLPQSSLFRYSLNDVGDEALPHINAQAAVLPESMVLAVERLSATAVSTDGMVAAQDMLTAEVERWGATSTRCVIEAETPMTNLRAGEPGMFT
ncbi:hypothetical protein CLV70_12728 [Pseudosporangium ferrugineum]|uniref:Uncharacterized protein n=2 Tax=Pseudosporangium ferrugineum TaxID=439699 RepID=A0A2T0RFF5_9ACTN|nr:hypothetical protein CLV70_12728 [Pseudosporangium ferrugineum]